MTGKNAAKRRWFIIMNSDLHYFSGFEYGGKLRWSQDDRDAKPLDDEAKFETVKRFCYGEELLLDYIN